MATPPLLRGLFPIAKLSQLSNLGASKETEKASFASLDTKDEVKINSTNPSWKAAPNVPLDVFEQISSDGSDLTFSPRSKEECADKLKEAADNGGIHKKDVEKAFDIKITDRAWELLTGKGAKEPLSPSELLLALQRYKVIQTATNVHFTYFIRCKNISVVDTGPMVKNFESLNQGQFHRMLELQKGLGMREKLKNVLAELSKTRDDLKYLNYDDNNDEALYEAIYGENGKGGLKMEEKEAIVFSLYQLLHSKIVETDKKPFPPNLKDPEVANKFAEDVFLPWMLNNSLPDNKVKEFNAFADKFQESSWNRFWIFLGLKKPKPVAPGTDPNVKTGPTGTY